MSRGSLVSAYWCLNTFVHTYTWQLCISICNNVAWTVNQFVHNERPNSKVTISFHVLLKLHWTSADATYSTHKLEQWHVFYHYRHHHHHHLYSPISSRPTVVYINNRKLAGRQNRQYPNKTGHPLELIYSRQLNTKSEKQVTLLHNKKTRKKQIKETWRCINYTLQYTQHNHTFSSESLILEFINYNRRAFTSETHVHVRYMLSPVRLSSVCRL